VKTSWILNLKGRNTYERLEWSGAEWPDLGQMIAATTDPANICFAVIHKPSGGLGFTWGRTPTGSLRIHPNKDIVVTAIPWQKWLGEYANPARIQSLYEDSIGLIANDGMSYEASRLSRTDLSRDAVVAALVKKATANACLDSVHFHEVHPESLIPRGITNQQIIDIIRYAPHATHV